MISKPIKQCPEIGELIRQSIAVWNSMSLEEKISHRREQTISWIYGNIALSNPNITREQVERHFWALCRVEDFYSSEIYGPE